VAQDWQTYRNEEFNFSLKYPSDWIIKSQSYTSVIFIPQAETSWQPSKPSDISMDPAVHIDLGEYIRERIGPAYFPETIDSDGLRAWIDERISSGEANSFSEWSLNNLQAFTVIEVGIPGCAKVVYWRPVNLMSLIRISTGCESSYLDEFNLIVDGIQQIE
jgi:hypothetical protein